MRSWILAALLLSAPAVSTAGPAAPLLGRIASDWETEDPSLRAILNEVISRAGYGALSIEQAAFLIENPGGGYRCELWPGTGERERQTFRGTYPRGTVAVVHSHPNCCRQPSFQDRRTARRLGLPIVVLTSRSVVLVSPLDGASHPVSPPLWRARSEASVCTPHRSAAAGRDEVR